MEDQQAPTPTIRRMAPKMWDKQGLALDDRICCAEDRGQAPTLDDQKHGAEDGGQKQSLDDQKHVAEHGGLSGADDRRSETWRRRWELAGTVARRSAAAPQMEYQQAPTPEDQTGAEDEGSAGVDAR